VHPLAISSIGSELLDDPAADPSVVAQSLGNIARANRWFGGARAVRYGLARVLAGVPRTRPLSLLDLGTGAGDLPGDAARWAAESCALVEAPGFYPEKPGTLPASYLADHQASAERRLREAGARLADLLNRALAPTDAQGARKP
jgi:hypothetical protein